MCSCFLFFVLIPTMIITYYVYDYDLCFCATYGFAPLLCDDFFYETYNLEVLRFYNYL